MQEMLYPTSYLKGIGLGRSVRCSPTAASRAARPGCRSATPAPEAACGGAIALVEDGDTIEIDIPNRRIHLAIADAELARRRAEQWRRRALRRGSR